MSPAKPEDLFFSGEHDPDELTPEQAALCREAWELHAGECLPLDRVADHFRDRGFNVSVPALSKALANYASHSRQDPTYGMQLKVRQDQLNALLRLSVEQAKAIKDEVEANDGKGLKQVEICHGEGDRDGYTKVKYLRPDSSLNMHIKTASDIIKTLAMLDGLMSKDNEADRPDAIVIQMEGFLPD